MPVLPAAEPAFVAPKSWRRPAEHWRTVLDDPWYRMLVEVLDVATNAISAHLRALGLRAVLMPSTTGSVSSPMGLGSDSEPVKIELYGVKTYLADSMQFMLEFGSRIHRDGVFYIMPCFRGEPCDSSHLSQFYHAECEIPGTLSDITALVDALTRTVTSDLLAASSTALIGAARSLEHLEAMAGESAPITRISFQEAVDDLRGGMGRHLVKRHRDGYRTLTRQGEQELVRRHGGNRQALWVTHFDSLAVPFYQAVDPATGESLTADLLLGGREVVGAGQRHATAEAVWQACQRHHVAREPYEWYGQMRDDSFLQTSGMGLGLERFLMWVLQHHDIRDLTVLVRDNGVDITP